MSLRPGRGRSASPPPAPPTKPPGQQRDVRPGLPRPPTAANGVSVLRWGVLFGGLAIIADLAILAIQQRSTGDDVLNALSTVDLIISLALYSMTGATVVRETGHIYLGAAAGLVAGLLDGVVIAAAQSLAPQVGEQTPLEWLVLTNVIEGAVLAALSAWVFVLARRRAGR